jgi:hypothetical protein
MQLALQRLFQALARLHLATGKLPPELEGVSTAPLARQNAALGLDQGCHHGAQRKVSIRWITVTITQAATNKNAPESRPLRRVV